MINAPVGFRFNPTGEELVHYYLANRVAGNSQDLWQGLINEFDMYTEEPWELWGRFYGPNLGRNNLAEAKSDKNIFFFTTPKKVASDGNGKRVNRRVGTSGGTWHEQNTKFVKGEGSWYERRFSYKNDKRKEQDGAWLMMEFCLHEDDNLVLCRIGKKPLCVDDDEDHRRYASVSTNGRSLEAATTLQASSPAVCDVNDNNFMVPAKRKRTDGMFSGSGISIVGEEQVQHHGGIGRGFGNQGSANMGIPYHHVIDQDHGGNPLFSMMRMAEVGAMNMEIPYHRGPDIGANNLRTDGSFPSNWMEGMNGKIRMGVEANISGTLSGPVLFDSGLFEPRIGVHGSTENNETGDLNREEIGDGSTNATMNPNTRMEEEGDTPIGRDIGEPDHEDNVDLFDLVDIVVGDIDELEEAMMANFPENYNNINGCPITRMQEEEDMGFGNNCDNDISLPGSTDCDDLDQCLINSLDEWSAELQRGDQSPIQRMTRR